MFNVILGVKKEHFNIGKKEKKKTTIGIVK
jgi:hypothetical protein